MPGTRAAARTAALALNAPMARAERSGPELSGTKFGSRPGSVGTFKRSLGLPDVPTCG